MSTIIKDDQGNIITPLDAIGGQELTDTRQSVYILGALNAQVVLPCQNTNSIAVDVRGTFVGTLVVEYSINGVDYINTAIFNPLTELFVPGITSIGQFVGHLPSGTKFVRVRTSAYTSGAVNVALRGSEGDNFIYAKAIPSTLVVTTLGAANTSATLTIPAPGAGLFHYITAIQIKRINASAAAIAGTALLGITSTNLPGSLAFSSGNALGVGEDILDVDLNFTGNPLKASAANTASTIVMPAGGAGVQYRATVYYYIGA